MSQPGGRPLQEQLDEVHRALLGCTRNRDPEDAHNKADNELTRLVSLLADGRGSQVQRTTSLALRAWSRVKKWYA